MQTRIQLNDLPATEQECLVVAVHHHALIATRRGWAGAEAAKGAWVFTATTVAALAKRGLLELDSRGVSAAATDAGIALVNGVPLEREVSA